MGAGETGVLTLLGENEGSGGLAKIAPATEAVTAIVGGLPGPPALLNNDFHHSADAGVHPAVGWTPVKFANASRVPDWNSEAIYLGDRGLAISSGANYTYLVATVDFPETKALAR